MRDMREAILEDRFAEWRNDFVDRYESGAVDSARSA